MQLPVDSEREFAFGDKREIPLSFDRDLLAEKYGEAVLNIRFPSGSSAVIFFTP